MKAVAPPQPALLDQPISPPAHGGGAGANGASAGSNGHGPSNGEVDLGRSVISSRWGRRDRISRRMLLLADMVGISLALFLATVLTGERDSPVELLLFALPVLPAWALLFKLYGLYDRDIRRISHAGIDDLPWLFHGLVVGTLLFWGYIKFVPDSRLLFEEAAWFGAIGLPLLVVLRSMARHIVLNRMGPERDPDRRLRRHRPRCSSARSPSTPSTAFPRSAASRRSAPTPDEHRQPEPDRPRRRGPVPLLGTGADLERLVSAGALDRVILCRADLGAPEVLSMTDVCHRYSVKVGIVPGAQRRLRPLGRARRGRGRHRPRRQPAGPRPHLALDQARLRHRRRVRRASDQRAAAARPRDRDPARLPRARSSTARPGSARAAATSCSTSCARWSPTPRSSATT